MKCPICKRKIKKDEPKYLKNDFSGKGICWNCYNRMVEMFNS